MLWHFAYLNGSEKQSPELTPPPPPPKSNFVVDIKCIEIKLFRRHLLSLVNSPLTHSESFPLTLISRSKLSREVELLSFASNQTLAQVPELDLLSELQ